MLLFLGDGVRVSALFFFGEGVLDTRISAILLFFGEGGSSVVATGSIRTLFEGDGVGGGDGEGELSSRFLFCGVSTFLVLVTRSAGEGEGSRVV